MAIVHRYVEVEQLVESDVGEVVEGDVMCVLMDPPLLLPGESPAPGKVSVQDLVRTHSVVCAQSAPA